MNYQKITTPILTGHPNQKDIRLSRNRHVHIMPKEPAMKPFGCLICYGAFNAYLPVGQLFSKELRNTTVLAYCPLMVVTQQ